MKQLSHLETTRHSAAHVTAAAILQWDPAAQIGIGPSTDTGFYYDIKLSKPLREEDLPHIEQTIQSMVSSDLPFHREEWSSTRAREYFLEHHQPFKVQLIDELAVPEVSIYRTGDGEQAFVDLCEGPHVPSTRAIGVIKLMNLAGAYWKGDAKNEQLTRIYGTAYASQEELDAAMAQLEQAKLRDHRKLGPELGIFDYSPLVGAGLPLWLPEGAMIRDILIEYLKDEQRKRGYKMVVTPHIGKRALYETSGHWQNYRDSMFPTLLSENDEYVLKPMNCPHHIEIYRLGKRSYRELPLRLAEFGTVYRYEQSGELGGLTRVRSFTQDDAHIFCTEDQVRDEFRSVLELLTTVLGKLGLSDFELRVGTRDPKNDKYVGSDAYWELAQTVILDVMKDSPLPYEVVEGEAAFYGPKLDLMVKDSIGRKWQLGTVQVDVNLPERFDLEYIGADGKAHRPIMIHRAPFGSLERFVGILIEHFNGAFPAWLAPTQVIVLPVSAKAKDYVATIVTTLKERGVRYDLDDRDESLGKRIREAEQRRVPYLLIAGEKDAAANTVSIRAHGGNDLGAMTLDAWIAMLPSE